MLQSIRDRTQGWIAGVIVSLLILSFALWGIHSYIGGGEASTYAAKINGVELSQQKLSIAYQRLQRQLQFQSNSDPAQARNMEAKLKERALQSLVEQEVLKQASLAQHYRISNNQVDNFLASMPEFQENGQFSPVRFEQLLALTMYSPDEFLQTIHAGLLIDQPRLGIIFTSFALPNEVSNTMTLLGQERQIRYLILPLSYFANQPITISKEKISEYYNQHQDEFKTPEQVSLEYVALNLKDIIADLHPTDEMMMNFYKENSSSYNHPAQWKLESIFLPLPVNSSNADAVKAEAKINEIISKARAGQDFALLARQNSLESNNPKLSGWKTVNDLPDELQRAVLALTKPGQISSPVRTQQGIILFKASDLKKPTPLAFSEAKENVKQAMIRQMAEEKFASLREKLSNLTYEHPESLQSAAQSLNLPIKNTSPFTREKGGTDLSADAKVRDAAFSNEVLNLRNNSDVIQVSPESAVVIRVKSHNPAASLPLNAVENQINEKLKAAEINDKASSLVNEWAKSLNSGQANLEQIASQSHAQLSPALWISRQSNKVDSAILNAAYAMPKQQTSTYTTVKVPNGYALVILDAVRQSSTNVTAQQNQVFADQIQNAQGLMEYELYKLSLMNRAKIEKANS